MTLLITYTCHIYFFTITDARKVLLMLGSWDEKSASKYYYTWGSRCPLAAARFEVSAIFITIQNANNSSFPKDRAMENVYRSFFFGTLVEKSVGDANAGIRRFRAAILGVCQYA